MGSLEFYDRNTYCQQYLYKKNVQLLLFFPKKVEFIDYDFFLFCYGVLTKLCFYLKNLN
jgi:hypothetical protein